MTSCAGIATLEDQHEESNITSPAEVMVLARGGGLATASEQAALVHVGLFSGRLRRCVEPTAINALAKATGTSPSAVERLCDALVAFGVLDREGSRLRLTTPWLSAVADGTDIMVGRLLRGTSARRQLIALNTSATYWTVEPALRRAVAESMAVPPATDVAHDGARLYQRPTRGPPQPPGRGRWLAEMILSLLQAYPVRGVRSPVGRGQR